MTATEYEFVPLERQLFGLSLGEALAGLARQKYPRDTAKHLARAWQIDPSTAANVLKGHASERTLAKAFRAEGWTLIDAIGKAVTGETYHEYEERNSSSCAWGYYTMTNQPLAIDLFCGLGGWTAGLLAEGWRCRGYDIEAHEYGDERYPGEFVLRDILELHGSEVADADLIVSSSPCTAYSYMAMPWSRAKAKAAAIRADETGELLRQLNALFDAQFRIQREANEVRAAKGLPPVPMVVENVRGAQPWVGQARGSFGSYYLWGDVPALLPQPINARKNPGFRFDGSGKSFQTESVERHVAEGRKHSGDWFRDPTCPTRQGGQVKRRVAEGRKGAGAGAEWFDGNLCVHSSKSPARKAASAKIAKIPFALSSHIARVYHPNNSAVAA